MILLITGATHTGKTYLAQKLMEQYKIPYLSVDHLKMGLIRAGRLLLTPLSSEEELRDELWPIIREMIKTAIENDQHMIIEGCYLPYDWQKDFDRVYAKNIRFICLCMTENYIRTHFDDILQYGSVIEKRLCDEGCTTEHVLQENRAVMERCQKFDIEPIWIDKAYEVDAAKIWQDVWNV